jgi:hypothetical protein
MTPAEDAPPPDLGLHAAAPAPEAADPALRHCRDWLGWAAAQVDACMGIDNTAMDQLLASLDDLIGSNGAGSAGGAPSAAAQEKLSAVVMAIQAHDRVMQGLTHLADSIRSLAAQLALPSTAGSEEAWQQLRERQFRTFSMAEERALFSRMVAHESDAFRDSGCPSSAAIELFSSDDDLSCGDQEL